jgi:hypothetical protein
LVSEIERRVKILEYLRENCLDLDNKGKVKKINKSDVMRHLEPISRLKTTHGTIVNLIDEGKIKMIKDKPHSQTHYLTINEKNEFNKIYDSLLEIENHIDAMDPFVNAIRELKRKDNEDESNAGHILGIDYQTPYETAVDKTLHYLLDKVSDMHLNHEDSEIAYKQIVKLFQKILSQRGHKDLKESTNRALDDVVSVSEHDIRQDAKYFHKYASIYDKYKVDFGVRDDLLQIIKDIKARFLS